LLSAPLPQQPAGYGQAAGKPNFPEGQIKAASQHDFRCSASIQSVTAAAMSCFIE
jgi:hypothetical protein